jgi:polyhydroxyalkanoate synthesis regulator phasin
MNSTDIAKLLQKGFYVTLGATANLLEVIQDPRKLDRQVNSLFQDFDGLTDELADKGAVTEAEARKLVDSLIAQQIPTSEPTTTITTIATTVVDSNVQADLQDLTQQLEDLRTELEQLRQTKN